MGANKRKTILTSGTLPGAARINAGVIGWKWMYESHSQLAGKNFKAFFAYLLPAHLASGLFIASTFKLQLDSKSAGS